MNAVDEAEAVAEAAQAAQAAEAAQDERSYASWTLPDIVPWGFVLFAALVVVRAVLRGERDRVTA